MRTIYRVNLVGQHNDDYLAEAEDRAEAMAHARALEADGNRAEVYTRDEPEGGRPTIWQNVYTTPPTRD